MSLFRIAWRTMWQRRLSTSLTATSMALGVALVIAVLVILNTVEDRFTRSAQGFQLIVGAKGGKLQLVLNTVYHLSTPIENIPWEFYKQFRPGGKYATAVDMAIPYCLGDSYAEGGHNFRVVGTLPELFNVDYAPNQSYRFTQGRNLHEDYENPDYYFEAVIGSVVAAQTGLTVGDTFQPTHGMKEGGRKHDSFKIVGVMAPTGTPNDRALFVNIEGFLLLDGHAKPVKGEEPHKPFDENGRAVALPESQRELTSILVRTKNDMFAMRMRQFVNEGNVAQAVQPIKEIQNLFNELVGPVRGILIALALLIVVVAGVGIMVGIYNSMSERVRDIAVMRALGAGRGTVMMVILLESTLLSLLGGVSGFVLAHGLIGGVLSPFFIAPKTGVSIGVFQFVQYELALIPGLVVLAALAGFLPAVAAYRTDVGRALAASP